MRQRVAVESVYYSDLSEEARKRLADSDFKLVRPPWHEAWVDRIKHWYGAHSIVQYAVMDLTIGHQKPVYQGGVCRHCHARFPLWRG